MKENSGYQNNTLPEDQRQEEHHSVIHENLQVSSIACYGEQGIGKTTALAYFIRQKEV